MIKDFCLLQSCKSTLGNGVITPTSHLYGAFDSEDEQERDKKMVKGTRGYRGKGQ